MFSNINVILLMFFFNKCGGSDPVFKQWALRNLLANKRCKKATVRTAIGSIYCCVLLTCCDLESRATDCSDLNHLVRG